MDELKGITLSKYKERYSTITGSNNRFDRRWKIKFFANLPRPCCKSISNGLGVDGKYFIITELPAPVLWIGRRRCYASTFSQLSLICSRQGDSPVKACIEMQRIRYYALA